MSFYKKVVWFNWFGSKPKSIINPNLVDAGDLVKLEPSTSRGTKSINPLNTTLVVGSTYTISFSVISRVGTYDNVSIFLFDGGVEFTMPFAVGKVSKYTFTASSTTPTKLYIYAGMRGFTEGNGFTISNVKLEIGDKVTGVNA